MTLLTREQLLAPHTLSAEDVPVPEWGGSVRVRSLSADDVLRLEEQFKAAKDIRRVLAVQLSAYMCDDAGESILTPEEAMALIKREHAAVKRIVMAGKRLNSVTDEAIQNAEEKSEPSRS